MPRRHYGIGSILLSVACASELTYPAPSRCLPDAASNSGTVTHPVVAELEIGIPAEFRRDTTVQYFHGGARWVDGEREIEVVNGTYTRASFGGVDLPSYSECFGVIGGYEVFIVRYVELESRENCVADGQRIGLVHRFKAEHPALASSARSGFLAQRSTRRC